MHDIEHLFYIKSLGRFVGGTAFGGTEGGDEELYSFHTLCQDSLIGKELIGQHGLSTGSADFIAEPDDGESKGFGLVLKRAGHKEALQMKDKRMDKNTSFFFTFISYLTKNPENQGKGRKSEQ